MFKFRRRKAANKKEIIINAESLETRVAVMESGRMEEYKVEHPTTSRMVGSIFKGVVQNLEDGLQAAFIDIGMKKNAFIHYWDMFPEDLSRLAAAEGEEQSRITHRRRQFTHEEISRHFPVGSHIVIQISKGPIGTKGPRATASLSIPSRYFVLMPGSKLRGISKKIEDEKERRRLKKILARLPVPEGCGLIIRTAGAGASSTAFVRDLRSLLAVWNAISAANETKRAPACLYQEPDLIERVARDAITDDVDAIIIDSPADHERMREILATISRRMRNRVKLYEGSRPIFEQYDVERQLCDAHRRKVMLKSGGCLVFDEAEALIAVDVNTGQHRGASNQDETILQVNTEAVQEVARQLRLRNVGGLVIIDLIDMRHKKHRNAVYQALKEALRKDRARTNVLPISPLGLIEMTRQRVDESIEATMYTDCPYCAGRGSVKSPLNMSVEIQRRLMAILRQSRERSQPMPELLIVVNPTILSRLKEEDEELLLTIQNKFNGRLCFRGDPNCHIEGLTVADAKTNEVLFSHSGPVTKEQKNGN